MRNIPKVPQRDLGHGLDTGTGGCGIAFPGFFNKMPRHSATGYGAAKYQGFPGWDYRDHLDVLACPPPITNLDIFQNDARNARRLFRKIYKRTVDENTTGLFWHGYYSFGSAILGHAGKGPLAGSRKTKIPHRNPAISRSRNESIW